MTIKITAAVTSVCAALLYVFGTIYPNDPFFEAVSSNMVIGLGRLILAGLLLNLAFRHRFSLRLGRQVSGCLAIVLAVFGLAGLLIPPLTYSLFAFIKPLDYIFMMEAAVILGLASVTYEPGQARLPRIARPNIRRPVLPSPARNPS